MATDADLRARPRNRRPWASAPGGPHQKTHGPMGSVPAKSFQFSYALVCAVFLPSVQLRGHKKCKLGSVDYARVRHFRIEQRRFTNRAFFGRYSTSL